MTTVAEAPPQLIRIDIDPEEMNRFKPHVAVVGDSAVAVRALLASLSPKSTGQRGFIADAKALAAHAIQKIQPMVSYLEVIRRRLAAGWLLRSRSKSNWLRLLVRFSGL